MAVSAALSGVPRQSCPTKTSKHTPSTKGGRKVQKIACDDTAKMRDSRRSGSSTRTSCLTRCVVGFVILPLCVALLAYRLSGGTVDIAVSPVIKAAAEESWLKLSTWFQARGGFLHPDVNVAVTVNHDGTALRGVVAEQDLAANTVIAQIPKHLLFTEASVPSVMNDDISGLDACPPEWMNDVQMKLTAALALQLKDEVQGRPEDADWWPYTEMLPSMQDFTGFHPDLAENSVTDDFLQLRGWMGRRGSRLLKDALMKMCFVQWSSRPGSPIAHLTWDDFQHAMLVVRTRVFDLVGKQGKSLGGRLVPFLDLINTAPSAKQQGSLPVANVELIQDWESGTAEIRITKDIKAGEELYVSYCPTCDNQHLATEWGVYFEDNAVAVSDFDADCMGTRTSQKRLGGVNRLRKSTEQALDLQRLDQARNQGLTAPRCKISPSSEKTDEQSGVRCLLARVAWESCAADWGYEWKHVRGRTTDPSARSRAVTFRSDSATLLAYFGEVKAAAKKYEEALELNPKNANLHSQYGLLLKELGQLQEAKAHLQKAASLEGRSSRKKSGKQ